MSIDAVKELCRRVRLAVYHIETGFENHEHTVHIACKDLREGEKAAFESVQALKEMSDFYRLKCAPIARRIVGATTPEQEIEACREMAKMFNDDLQNTLHPPQGRKFRNKLGFRDGTDYLEVGETRIRLFSKNGTSRDVSNDFTLSEIEEFVAEGHWEEFK